MKHVLRASIAALALFSTAWAQDGGKLAWRGKTPDDPKAAMADAKKDSKQMMLFFTSAGSQHCAKLSAGAFSDDEVVKASQAFACIYIECNMGKFNADLVDRYGITGYPTVIFCDPEGNSLGRLNSNVPADVVTVMKGLEKKPEPKPEAEAAPVKALRARPIGQALVEGRKAKKPVLLLFYDDSPPALSIHAALTDNVLQNVLYRFEVGVAEYRKGSEECARFDITRAPTIVVVDPTLQKPEEKPLAKIVGSRSARELLRELEGLVPSAKSDAPAAVAPATGGRPPPQPSEPLSDDELERKFTQARIAAALELQKKGKKEKAIETLEDVIKSYPKHVETVTARKLLEEYRK